jgi:hypothetical protein
MKLKYKWESINTESSTTHQKRVKVVGGWIVHIVETCEDSIKDTSSCVFIPDSNHVWELIDNK